MAEIDILPAGQGDGAHALQRLQITVVGVDVIFKGGIPHTGGQLPHLGNVVSRAGVREGQHNGVGGRILGLYVGIGQGLQAAQAVQHGVIILGKSMRCGQKQQTQHQPRQYQLAKPIPFYELRGKAPPARFVSVL